MHYATADEMARLDELAVAGGLEIRQMMELAGWHMVTLFNRLAVASGEQVVVVCGNGNKGGDGLAAARHLSNYGHSVEVLMVDRDITTDARHHLKLVQRMDIPVYWFADRPDWAQGVISSAQVLIDALIGYRLDGNPRAQFAEAISLINNAGGRAISYDIPSGVDATTGHCLSPCVQAEATLTLAMPKRAFEEPAGQRLSGQVYVADLGIPEKFYREVGVQRPSFSAEEDGLIALTA